MRTKMLVGPLALVALAACSDDDGSQMPTPDTGPGPDGSVAQMFQVELKNISMAHSYWASGEFDVPLGKSSKGPIGPGDAFEVTFDAPVGSSLSFATMFGQSNDLFYAPDEQGIPLYDQDGKPTPTATPGPRRTRSRGSERTRRRASRDPTPAPPTPTRWCARRWTRSTTCPRWLTWSRRP